MTSMIAKYISKKVLGETMQNNFGKEVIQTYLQVFTAKLTLDLGPILRDRSCDPFTMAGHPARRGRRDARPYPPVSLNMMPKF